MNWFKSKVKEQAQVTCASCQHTQMVAEGITATFCEKCNKSIFVDKAGEKPAATNLASSPKPSSEKQAPTQQGRPLEQPKSSTQPSNGQPKTEAATIGSEADGKSPFPGEGSKKVRCPYCRAMEEVPNIAIQSFCGSCGQRIHLQDYHIRGRFHGDLETRGEVCITENADVTANLNVGRATIQGRIKGEILTEHVTVIANGGLLLGKVVSPSLVVHEGGGFVGEAIIGEPPSKKS